MSAASDDATPRVLLALTGAPFEESLLGALARPGARLTVGRRCLDVVDLLAAAEAGVAAYAVVWPGLHGLDREVVARLVACGAAVLGVAEAGSVPRLLDLGLAGVVELRPDEDPTAAAPRLATELTSAVRAVARAVAGRSSAAGDPGFAALPGPWGAPSADPAPPTQAGLDVAAAQEGRLLAVWGPVGSPGRSSVALAVADELARSGRVTLLADADTYGPSLAQRLGVLDEASGLAAAVRAASDGPPNPRAVAAAARALPGGLRLLTGLTRPDRWPELRPAALAAVWRTCRLLADVVVVDCGFCLEDDEELAYDTLAPRRNGSTLLTVDTADLVIAVGAADAVGTQRLIRGLADLRERRADGEVAVVVTRVRDRGREVTRVLQRYAGVDEVTLVPDDREAFARAEADGRLLADASPRSPARLALKSLAATLA